jgi:hypothetical protein
MSVSARVKKREWWKDEFSSLRVTLTTIEVGDPPIEVYEAEFSLGGASWPETFGSKEDYNKFTDGLKAGLAFSDKAAVTIPSIGSSFFKQDDENKHRSSR